MTILDDVEGKLTPRAQAAIFAEAKAAGPKETIDILVGAGVIDEKPWWTSVGINGSVLALVSAVVAIISGIAHYYGYTVDSAALSEIVLGLIGLVTAAMTWVGRLRAFQPISRSKVAPGVDLEKSR